MSDDFTIKFDGLTEIYDKLEKVRNKYPFKEKEILQTLGKSLKASAKDKTPIGEDKKHLKDSYKVEKVEFGNAVTSVNLVSKSSIYHLIEAGHNIVKGKGGDVTGFAPGKHMVETSVKEMETTLPVTVNAWLDNVLGDLK